MQQKQKMMIGGVILAIALVTAGAIFAVYKMTSKSSTAGTEAKPEEKKKVRVNKYDTITIDERPYLEVAPLASGHDVSVTINSVKKPAESVEYELEYQSGELQQGQFGTIPLTTFPAFKEILLGSRSAGGATTYHENVLGGTLVTRFSGTNEYAHKNDWRYIDNKAKEKSIGSKDAKFQLDSPEFAKQRFMIVTNSPGYPGELPGTPISGIYVVSYAGTAPTGKAKITLRTSEEAAGAKIAVYDGKEWKTVAAKAAADDAKSLSAEVELAKMYVAIK